MGEAADRLAVDCSAGLLEELAAALVAGLDLDDSLAGSSAFFLPSPNKPRTLLFLGGIVSISLGLGWGHGAVARTFSPLGEDAGPNGSARAEAWADGPLCSGAVLARLMVEAE